jgi:hypothetical protein
MKRFWTAMAVTCLAFGWLAGCNDYNSSIQYNTGASLTNLSPSGITVGSPAVVLTLNALPNNGFATTSVVRWNGQALTPTTFVDTTTIYATVPASLLAKTGVGLVNVLTPQSGTGMNGLSNTKAFYVYSTTPNPVPTVTSVMPASAPACGTSCANVTVPITVTGTNFLPTSNSGGSLLTIADMLTPNQQPASLTIKSISATQIQAVIPGIFLANADTANIAVCNPPNIPGGGICGQCPDITCVTLAGGGYSPTSLPFVIGGGAPAAAVAAEETPAISQDGRYVAYSSQQNQVNQILLKDTCVGVTNGCTPSTRVVSAAGDGTAGNVDSHNAVISADGRYVAFSSAATNLVEGAAPGRQVYLHDTCIGAANGCKSATTLISIDPQGALTGTESVLPAISSSGRFVAFVAITPSNAPKTAGGASVRAEVAPNSGLRQVFVRDTCLGATNCTPSTTRISLMPGDAPANGAKPAGPAISGLAKQIALADGKTATVFTPTVAVDDGVFLAIPKEQ